MEQQDELRRRIERLEGENWRWRIAASIGLVLVAALVVLGATTAKILDEVKAKRIVVVDDTGRVRIALGKGAHDGYELSVINKTGVTGAVLYAADIASVGMQSGLDLNDIKGHDHVNLSVYSDPDFDRATLNLRGAWREIPNTLPVLNAAPEVASLEVRSRRGVSRPKDVSESTASFSLRTAKVGSNLWLDGKLVSLSFDNYEAAPPVTNLDILHKGSVSISLSEGQPALTLSDKIGGPSLVLGHTSLPSARTGAVQNLPASSLVMFDTEGKVIWKAP